MSRPVFVNATSTGEEEVYFNVVGPRYFEILRTPVIVGRGFTQADDTNSPAVVVVNETFARRYLQASNPLGQRVSFTGPADEMQIVGVVKDAVYETL
jgi:putative ABC transport system permease protein